MPFEFPSLQHVLYRAWRLRRLIALGTILPLLLFAFTGATGLGGPAGTATGLAVTLIMLLGLVGGHAVLFPNAWEETLAFSCLLAIFAVFVALLGGSVLAWIAFLIAAPWFVMHAQARILTAFTNTSRQRPAIKARIRIEAPAEKVRETLPLRPNREIGQFRCGPAGKDGVFPVWYDMPVTDIFDSFMPAGEDTATSAAEGVSPSFFALIDTDKMDVQKTLILTLDSEGRWQTDAIVEHRFKTSGNATVVTETETPSSFPLGQIISLWLNDFQKDGLVYLRDLIEKRETFALRAAHRWSILTLTGKWVTARLSGRLSGT